MSLIKKNKKKKLNGKKNKFKKMPKQQPLC